MLNQQVEAQKPQVMKPATPQLFVRFESCRGHSLFSQVSDGFQISVEWSRLVLVGAVVGDWLASDDAAWQVIVNRVASAANELGIFHQPHPMQRIGRRRVRKNGPPPTYSI